MTLRQFVRDFMVGATLTEMQYFLATTIKRGDTVAAGYAKEFIYEVCMENLEVVVKTTIRNLTDALKGLADPINTADLLNRVVDAARISPIEGYMAGREAWHDIMSCAHFAKRYCDNLSARVRRIALDYRVALDEWYQSTN